MYISLMEKHLAYKKAIALVHAALEFAEAFRDDKAPKDSKVQALRSIVSQANEELQKENPDIQKVETILSSLELKDDTKPKFPEGGIPYGGSGQYGIYQSL